MEKRRVFRLSLKQRKMADAVKELAESQTYTEIQKVITSVRNGHHLFDLKPVSNRYRESGRHCGCVWDWGYRWRRAARRSMRSARVDGQGPTLGLLDHFKHFRIDRVQYFADQATAMAWQRFYWCVSCQFVNKITLMLDFSAKRQSDRGHFTSIDQRKSGLRAEARWNTCRHWEDGEIVEFENRVTWSTTGRSKEWVSEPVSVFDCAK